MKKDIHPTYFPKAKMICSCGNIVRTGSVKELVEVEICSNCHPFYTGQEKLVDTAGRVEKFKTRAGKKQADVKARREKRKAKREKRINK